MSHVSYISYISYCICFSIHLVGWKEPLWTSRFLGDLSAFANGVTFVLFQKELLEEPKPIYNFTYPGQIPQTSPFTRTMRKKNLKHKLLVKRPSGIFQGVFWWDLRLINLGGLRFIFRKLNQHLLTNLLPIEQEFKTNNLQFHTDLEWLSLFWGILIWIPHNSRNTNWSELFLNQINVFFAAKTTGMYIYTTDYIIYMLGVYVLCDIIWSKYISIELYWMFFLLPGCNRYYQVDITSF